MRIVAGLIALLFVSACGGGSGGTGGGGSTPPNDRPPTITSAASASVPENTSGSIYQATATDPDGNAVTFTLEGTDAGQFNLSANGSLSFVTPPDFEAPKDGNVDNVYQITIVANDGINAASDPESTARLNVTITVTNLLDRPSVRRIAGFGTTRIADATAVPGTAKLFVAAQDGGIYLTDPTVGGTSTPYLPVADLYLPTSNQPKDFGLLSIVAAPDYATSGYIYVYVISSAGNLELRRYGRLPSGAGDPASADVILTIPSGFLHTNTAGGGLVFGPDGFLYLGVGDGRQSVAPDGTAQDLSSLRGKVLRIDVSRDDFPADPNRDYGIPNGNPFSTGAREIYAYGLENPRRMNFEGPDLLIGDAHALDTATFTTEKQEIDLLRPQDAGANFGYHGLSGAGITAPVINVSEGSNSMNIGHVTGGFVYQGPIQQYAGLYFFADAYIYTLPATRIMQGVTLPSAQATRLNATLLNSDILRLRSFVRDANNNLYLVPDDEATIYAVELQ